MIGSKERSLINSALLEIETQTRAQVILHLTKNPLDFSYKNRAKKMFFHKRLETETPNVFFYVNLKLKKFIILYNEPVSQKLNASYWQEFKDFFIEDLISTHPENALHLAINTLGVGLRKHFPADK